MSNYKTHLIVGFVFVIITIAILLFLNKIGLELFKTREILIFTIPIVFLYSILADIDHKTSKITWIFLTIGIFMVVVGYAFTFLVKFINMLSLKLLLPSGIILLVVTFIGTRLKHRGFTHSILVNIIVTIPLIFIHWFVALAGFLAFFSHLLIDKEIHWR